MQVFFLYVISSDWYQAHDNTQSPIPCRGGTGEGKTEAE